MGLRDIERKLATKSAYQRHDAEIMLQELDGIVENVEALKKQLKKFEKKHGKEISKNKEQYEKISQLREELGLPPEIGVYEWKEAPSLMDRLRSKGYFDQLANEILELGKDAKANMGGLMSVAELVLKINKSRPGKIVPPKDVIKSLKILVDSQLIQPTRKLTSEVLIAEFISIELSEDQEIVFDLASRKGFITKEKLILDTTWVPERATRVLDELMKQGLVLKDDSYQEGTKYWFPSLGE